MLLANITVSKKILRHYPTLAVLRRHQPPSREQFAPLLATAAAVGQTLQTVTILCIYSSCVLVGF